MLAGNKCSNVNMGVGKAQGGMYNRVLRLTERIQITEVEQQRNS